jgi:predicted DNA-binding transcriptional regulator YafY
MEMARHAFAIFRGTPFFDQFDTVFSRITGSKVLRNLQQGVNSRLIQVDEQGTDTGVRWLQVVYKAIVQKKALLISYKPYGQSVKTRMVSPYLLKEYRNKWYMVAHAREIGDGGRTNLFKLFRIEKIESCKEPYVSDDQFNPDGYFRHSLGIFHSHELQPELIHLFFSKTIAPLILESPLHHSMKVLRQNDGGIEVTLYVFNTVELKNLVLSFGDQCRVISPASLQDDIRTSLMKALEQYEK